MSPSEYQLNLALIEEYRDALRWKRNYKALTEEFCGLLEEFMAYCDSKGINPARDPKMVRLIGRIKEILSDETYHSRRTDENLPEP